MNTTDPRLSCLREDFIFAHGRKKPKQSKLLLDMASLVFQIIFRLRGYNRKRQRKNTIYSDDEKKDLAKDVSKDTPDDMSKDMADDMSKDMADDTSEDDVTEDMDVSSHLLKDEETFILENFREEFVKIVLALKKKHNADEIILARDVNRKQIWRMKIFDKYKANRNMNTKHQGVNIKLSNIFIGIYHFMYDIIVNDLNAISIKAAEAEADDIIAVLTRHFVKENHRVVIIADDFDYFQLLRYPNVEIYDNYGQNFLEKNPRHPKEALRYKILRGDRSDNIPSCQILLDLPGFQTMMDEWNVPKDYIFSYEEIERLVQMELVKKKCVQKEAFTLQEDVGQIEKLLDEDPLFYQTFIRNATLIDMCNIPLEISERILEKYTKLSSVTKLGLPPGLKWDAIPVSKWRSISVSTTE